MNKPIKYEKERSEGDIFFIPLFLPDWSVRKRDDLLNYGVYKFPADGMYAFGRVIYNFPSNYDLIEVFRYTGSIPAEPDIITRSGRLFAPLSICMGFGNKRYRFIFTDERYDKVRDSAYDKITFLMNETDIWVGGKQITVGREKRNAPFRFLEISGLYNVYLDAVHIKANYLKRGDCPATATIGRNWLKPLLRNTCRNWLGY
jgi:hypothetical protein